VYGARLRQSRTAYPRSDAQGYRSQKRTAWPASALSEKGDPLEAIAALVPSESFRANIETAVLTPEEAKKSKAGRKPFDALVMFWMLVRRASRVRPDGAFYRRWIKASTRTITGITPTIPPGP
jgi:hypothetical protein